MSTLENHSETSNAHQEIEDYFDLAEKAIAIVRKFKDNLVPIAPKDFKEMLFYTLHSAYTPP